MVRRKTPDGDRLSTADPGVWATPADRERLVGIAARWPDPDAVAELRDVLGAGMACYRVELGESSASALPEIALPEIAGLRRRAAVEAWAREHRVRLAAAYRRFGVEG